jgi:tRNA (uracil-5-)-methyltransferase TRM9
MKQSTIDELNAINRRFYETTAVDFDQTRGKAWAGWAKLKDHLKAPLSVLDVGCGNGRFGLFLAEELKGEIRYHGIDNNAQLLAFAKDAFAPVENLHAKLEEADIVNQPLPEGEYDLVVLFGVIHHVPSAEKRKSFVADLAKCVKAGGLLCFASWRFYEFERFRERLTAWPEHLKAEVENHDFLLDWRRGENALRYCHYVDDAEEKALIEATGLQFLSQYRADGENNALNSYVVLKRS